MYYHVRTSEEITCHLLKQRKKASFLPSVDLFLCMCLIAEIINVVCHHIFHDIHVEPNMFYITPFYPSTQPVLSDIAQKCGIPVEIAVYLGLIILTSFILYSLFRALAPWTENGSARR